MTAPPTTDDALTDDEIAAWTAPPPALPTIPRPAKIGPRYWHDAPRGAALAVYLATQADRRRKRRTGAIAQRERWAALRQAEERSSAKWQFEMVRRGNDATEIGEVYPSTARH